MAQQQKIAAVVNEDVISVHDIEARIALVIGTSGLTDSPEARRRLLPQVVRVLVDEKLKMQEARQLKLAVTDAELKQMVGFIEKQNKLPPGGYDRVLAQRGLDRNSAQDLLRADIAWIKVAQRVLSPNVNVGEDEVDGYLDRYMANLGKPENLVSDIFIAVDSPTHEEEIKTLMTRLGEQIAAGADFTAVARQFSQSPTAAVGGDLGWNQQGAFEDELEKALDQMQPGQLRGVRTLSGWHLLLLRERRQPSGDLNIALSQILVPPATPKAQDIIAKARSRTSCADMDGLARSLNLAQSGSLGTVKAKDLPDKLRRVVVVLPVNTPSEPLATEGGTTVLMVCQREEPTNLPSRKEVSKKLEDERLEMLSRRHLRDLRRNAYVDLRL